MTSHTHRHEDIPDEMQRRNQVLRRLKQASLLCTTFLIVEVVGGWVSGSLAVLSDAAHLLADLAAFAVAIGASYLASLPSTSKHTYGLKRTESLAALFSMSSLALVSVGLFVEALRRLWPIITKQTSEIDVDGQLMSIIAAIGVIVNLALAFILGEHHVHMPGADHGHSHDHDHGEDSGHGNEEHSHNHVHTTENHTEPHNHGHHSHEINTHEHQTSEKAITMKETDHLLGSHNGQDHHLECETLVIEHNDELEPPTSKSKRNINLRAAYIHVLGDLAQSVAVLIAGLVIWLKPEWQIVDPICTMLFCAIVFYSTLGVLRSSISVLLEEVPPDVNWGEVHTRITLVNGVSRVHDLHIWSISHGIPSLSVHASSRNPAEALENIAKVCQSFGIDHATIQVQHDSIEKCVTCCPKQMASCHIEMQK